MEQLLETAREHGATARPLAALLAAVLAFRGDTTGSPLALVEQALDEGPGPADEGLEAFMPQALTALLFMGDLDRANVVCDELIGRSRRQGTALGLAVGLCFRGAVHTRRGRLVRAETDLRAVLDLMQERALAFALPTLVLGGIDALIERHELADVAALATTVELDPDLARTLSGAMLREARGRLELAGGKAATAAAEVEAAAATYRALHVLNPNFSCWRSALALTGAFDRAEALRLVDSELEDARRLGLPAPVGIVLRARGLLEGGERGLRDLRQAIRVLEGSYARLEHARALVELGAALRRGNQRMAAREPLRAGLDLAHHCGANRLAKRARAELAATGARPRRAALTGLDALTPSERRVAELAAERMTNPQIAQALFVTLNTVEGHLRHAYQKLSINSREQLPGALKAAAPLPQKQT